MAVSIYQDTLMAICLQTDPRVNVPTVATTIAPTLQKVAAVYKLLSWKHTFDIYCVKCLENEKRLSFNLKKKSP